MHHNIRYRVGPDGDRPAVLDAVQWLGYRRARIVHRELRGGADITLEGLRALLSFCGVEGRPVAALWKRWRREAVCAGEHADSQTA